MDSSSKQVAESVPGWDGMARGWRRYQREVMWYWLGTKKEQRKLLAPRLVSKLTGPARLLAMSWNQADLAGPRGVATLIAKLQASPLVRKQLPNTAAVMSQYFNYKRRPYEPIQDFLVREALFFEEFTEALLGLQGGQPDLSIFDLVHDDDDEDETDGSTTGRRDGYRRVPTADGDADGAIPTAKAKSAPTSPAARSQRSTRPPQLSATDSFILTQLRGYRLLAGAALTSEEWRSILAATGNKLGYEEISTALATLFDEQIFHRGQSHGHHGHGPPVLHLAEQDDQWWPPEPSWWEDDPWAAAVDWSGGAESMWGQDEPPEPEGDDGPPLPEEEQEAMMANRTWSQAQKTSQVMKKDRGFGAASAASRKGEGCWICHGPHLARDCPDRLAPKGKGHRNVHFMDESYDQFAYMKGKGKRKGHDGPRMAYMMDELYNFFIKGKGKNYGKSSKGKSKNHGNVNAYSMEDYSFHGLEIEHLPEQDQVFDLGRVERDVPGPAGMLDCGATCSAGPESSIKGLVNAVIAQDRATKVTIDATKRPRFRFGSGSWGRALYFITIQPSVSGRNFSAYVLPDPADANEPWFERHMLVPVLIGMDFIRGNKMIVDFQDGYTICATDPEAQPFIMDANSRGHYMVNIVDFLCGDRVCTDGPPNILVLGEIPDPTFNTQNQPVLDVNMVTDFEFEINVKENEQRLQNVKFTSDHVHFNKLWKRRMEIEYATHRSRDKLMGNSLSQSPSTSTSSPSSFAHGAQEGKDPAELGPGARSGDGSPGPKGISNLAMHGTPRPKSSDGEQMGSLESLPDMCPATSLHSEAGISGQSGQLTKSQDCGESLEAAARDLASRHEAHRGALPDLHGQGLGRGPHRGAAQGPSEDQGQGDLCRARDSPEDQIDPREVSESQESAFRRLYRYGATAVSKLTNSKLGLCLQSERVQSSGLPDSRGEARPDEPRGHSCPDSGDGQRHGDSHGAELWGQPVIEEPSNKLPLRVGQGLMDTIHKINSELNLDLTETIYGPTPLIWEMFCSKDSRLTEACLKEGIPTQRINLHNNFDLYKAETYEDLWTLFLKQRPKKFWISAMCTLFCDWKEISFEPVPWHIWCLSTTVL